MSGLLWYDWRWKRSYWEKEREVGKGEVGGWRECWPSVPLLSCCVQVGARGGLYVLGLAGQDGSPMGTDNPIVSLGRPDMEVWWRDKRCQITYGFWNTCTQSHDFQNNQSVGFLEAFLQAFNFEKEIDFLHGTNVIDACQCNTCSHNAKVLWVVSRTLLCGALGRC